MQTAVTLAVRKIAFASLLAVTTVTPSFAAIEIDEKDFGPSYETMAVDAVAGKPLGLLAAAGGVAAFAVSLPFTIFTGDVEQAKQKLIVEPFRAMDRCLGCTPAEDRNYKAQHDTNGQVRVVVDGPSEILINTNQNVVVKTP